MRVSRGDDFLCLVMGGATRFLIMQVSWSEAQQLLALDGVGRGQSEITKQSDSVPGPRAFPLQKAELSQHDKTCCIKCLTG
jgi:hypothetical protein